MSKCIILGDAHLGKSAGLLGKAGVGSNVNSRITDQIALLDWTLERAIDLMADHIIMTGDLFEDYKPSTNLIVLFLSWLQRCRSNHVNVHIILGNHDLFRSGNVLNSPLDIISEFDLDNVNVYKNINTITINSTSITFLPFVDRKSFGSVSNSEAIDILRKSIFYELSGIPISYKKILIGHLALEGSIPIGDEIDDITNELFITFDMVDGFNQVWFGHVHKWQILRQTPSSIIGHIGSMDLSNFGESEHKKQIVIIDCNLSSNEFTTEIIPTRPLKKINISVLANVPETTEYIIEEINNRYSELNKAIVKLDIFLSFPDLKSINKSQLEKFLMEKGVFHITNISESRKATPIKKENNSLDNKMDVPAAIKIFADKQVEENARNEFIKLSMEIYNDFNLESK